MNNSSNSLNNKFAQYSTCDYAEHLPAERVMHYSIRPLWLGMPRLVGPAFTARSIAGDNLTVHAAMYQAPKGSVLVVQAGDDKFAVAGGNVCATAIKLGIKGFVIDGVVRDLGEIREMAFPVFALGNVPKPGVKKQLGEIAKPVNCGTVLVETGDMIVADEEGIVAIPQAKIEEIFAKTAAKVAADKEQELEAWQQAHRANIEALVAKLK